MPPPTQGHQREFGDHDHPTRAPHRGQTRVVVTAAPWPDRRTTSGSVGDVSACGVTSMSSNSGHRAKLFLSVAVGQQSVVPHLHEARGQHVQQEPADEIDRHER